MKRRKRRQRQRRRQLRRCQRTLTGLGSWRISVALERGRRTRPPRRAGRDGHGRPAPPTTPAVAAPGFQVPALARAPALAATVAPASALAAVPPTSRPEQRALLRQAPPNEMRIAGRRAPRAGAFCAPRVAREQPTATRLWQERPADCGRIGALACTSAVLSRRAAVVPEVCATLVIFRRQIAPSGNEVGVLL